MASFIVLRALLRDRANLFQSFVQPFLLVWILAASLAGSFEAGPSSAGTQRALFLSFPASEFYAVVVLLVTVLVASQYATGLAVQCTGPGAAVRPRIQYGSPVRTGLSVATGIVLLVIASAVFFLAASGLLLGVSWPWGSSAFWILLGGLILGSIMGGFALGLATRDRGLSDLLISVFVFASALGAGAFFPYPETSRIWTLAPYNPFTQVLARLLALLRGSAVTPGVPEYLVLISAIGPTAIVVRQLARRTTSYRPGRRRGVVAWVVGRQPLILCSLSVLALPLAIWMAGPVDFVPSGLPDAAGLMYPYAGLATVLLLVLNMLLAGPLVDSSALIRNMRSFRVRFLFQRATVGIGLILMSVVIASAVWRPPLGTAGYAGLSLVLFNIWSLVAMFVVAQAARDKMRYWALALSITLLITFSGGSFWRPALLGTFGQAASYVLPNGLLLHHAPLPGLSIVVTEIMLLFLAAAHAGRRREPARSAQRVPGYAMQRVPGYAMQRAPGAELSAPRSAPARVHGDMVESLMLGERRRILDEVHDTLGHGITGALWQIRSAKGMTEDPSLQETLDRAAEGLEHGLSRIRGYLRDSVPRRSSDWSGLYAAVDQFSHCPVKLSLTGDSAGFHPSAVKRFTQTIRELLTNALRYGDPTSIHVHLVRTGRFHRLEYREHGLGWGSKGPRMGYGLSTVQALFTEVGGSFHLDNLPDAAGIQVIGIIPSRALSVTSSADSQETQTHEP